MRFIVGHVALLWLAIAAVSFVRAGLIEEMRPKFVLADGQPSGTIGETEGMLPGTGRALSFDGKAQYLLCGDCNCWDPSEPVSPSLRECFRSLIGHVDEADDGTWRTHWIQSGF
jgi:hypothetical protein